MRRTSYSSLLIKISFGIGLAGLVILISSCAPATGPNPSTQNATPAATVQCVQKLVLPTITEVQPARITPGSKIKVIGRGGYLQDSCGGYNESSRNFKLYIDQQPTADLNCYVNRCEVETELAPALAPGTHCLSVEKDGCEYKLQIETQ